MKILGVLIAVLALTGCAYRDVDVVTTGAELVAGTANLYRFCDGRMLIYYSDWSDAPDEFEKFLRDGCKQEPDGVYRPDIVTTGL